jgi:bifunctional UDP-N-acetylglucosamine pyrophosphorylase/glucosamine-1-phosphate N-acetyltransferase
MATQALQAIILAAGKASRFNTGKTKLLEKICGQEIIIYQTKLLEALQLPTTVVVGYEKEKIKETILKHHGDTITFALQPEQTGTGHAILCAKDHLAADNVFVMDGDIPLITPEIIAALYHKHKESNATVSFVIAHNPDPSIKTYSRVITGKQQIKVVEPSDFYGDTHEHCCINAGIYLVKRSFLEEYLHTVAHSESKKEHHFSDIVALASAQHTVTTVPVPFDLVRNIDTLQELWAVEHIKRAEIIMYWMEHGVRFSVAQNVHIDLNVTIGQGSYIGCGIHLVNGTKIGNNCQIHEFSALDNTIVDDNSTIESHCIIKDSHIGRNTQVGPFAHIREQSHIGNEVVIGNFVEIKKSFIGDKSTAKHLAYLGDATLGSDVNIGAGTVICNYDGITKNKTIIQDNAFIGSNSTIVAPITIGKNAFTGAGSVITEDVPEDTLALGRAQQVNKQGYTRKTTAL